MRPFLFKSLISLLFFLPSLAFAASGPPAGAPILNSRIYQRNSQMNIDTATIRTAEFINISSTVWENATRIEFDGLTVDFTSATSVAFPPGTIPTSLPTQMAVQQDGDTRIEDTGTLNFIGPLAVSAGSTLAQVALDASSVTLKGNVTNAGSGLAQLSGGVIPNAIIDTSSVTKLGNGNIVFPGTLTGPNQPSFQVYLSADAVDVTGDGTTALVQFDQELRDARGEFDPTSATGHAFTATIAGDYLFTAQAALKDAASGNRCEGQLVITNPTRIFVQPQYPQAQVSLPITQIVYLDVGDKAFFRVDCDGGSRVIDLIGNNGTFIGTGYPTFFSGRLLP